MNKNLLSVDEALEILLSHSKAVSELEEIPTLEATSRVLARAQRSTMDVPPMDNSAMDGYAVRTRDGVRLQIAQKIMAGSTGKPLQPGTAARIFTGAPIPPGADAVVMQEHCEVRGDEVLRRAAAECDLIVTSGGVSVGDADYVKPAVEAEGALLMWKIAMKPGRPLAFGRVLNSSFIGLPGNPVSSFVTFLIFVRPFLLKTQGITDVQAHAIPVRADFDWPEPDPRREFLRVKWNARGGLDLYPTQDSAVLTSTAWADGLVDNPAEHRIRAGDMVKFMPYSELYR